MFKSTQTHFSVKIKTYCANDSAGLSILKEKRKSLVNRAFTRLANEHDV